MDRPERLETMSSDPSQCATARTPSHLTSNAHSGSENGFDQRIASIGE